MLQKLAQLTARVKTSMTVLASATVLCCGLANTAQAISFGQISQVYFFGDSLTDSGFNDLWPGLPVGKAPTFTTFGGYTWSQYVASDIKGFQLPVYPGPNPADRITNNAIYSVPNFVSGTLTGVNYAAAGSTTGSGGFNETWAPSLDLQINYFLATKGPADPNAVYFIWSGANDLLSLLSSSPSQLQLLMASNTAANNIASEVQKLSISGAKRVVVVSLPNLGITPFVTETATSTGNPGLPGSLKTVSFTFNSMLNSALGKIAAQYGTKILYIDTFDLLDNVVLAFQAGQPYVVAGQAFQFANVTDPACSTVQQAISCPSTAPNNYLFADTIHPSGMAHRLLSLYIETQLQNWA